MSNDIVLAIISMVSTPLDIGVGAISQNGDADIFILLKYIIFFQLTSHEKMAYPDYISNNVSVFVGFLVRTSGLCRGARKLTGENHRDKTRAQLAAKMFPHLKIICLLFMGPTLGIDTNKKNSFLIKFGVF